MATHNGYDVAQIQQMLNAAGYQPPLAVDGQYGPKTEAAVRWYQQNHDLKVDGDVGPQTWGSLNGGGSQPAASGGSSPSSSSGSGDAQWVQENYPQYSWLLADPQIANILMQAKDHSPEWVQSQLYGTDYWKTNSSAMRNEALLYHMDPASWQENRINKSKDILVEAKSLGISLPPGSEVDLADLAIRYGWSDQFLRDELVNRWQYSSTGQTGAAAAAQRSISDLAAQYNIPVGDAQMQEWERQVLDGQIQPDELRQHFIEAAQGKYPSIAKALGEGRTVQQIADPYIQQAAQDLGVDPASISLSDPKWNVFLQNPTNDGPQLMTLYDWSKYYRTNPQYGYDYSPQARQQSASLVGAIAQKFGAVA